VAALSFLLSDQRQLDPPPPFPASARVPGTALGCLLGHRRESHAELSDQASGIRNGAWVLAAPDRVTRATKRPLPSRMLSAWRPPPP